MPTFDLDRRDQDFILHEQLEVTRLQSVPRFAEFSRDIADAIVEQAYTLATEALYPLNKVGDREGCVWSKEGVRTPPGFADAFRRLAKDGWLAMAAPPEFGGQGLPLSIGLPLIEIMTAANVAFMMYPGLTIAAANLLARFGTEEMKRTLVPRLYRGEWAGTMCLTEAQAGSAVGDLTTRAVPEGDHYRIEGSKIFISCGEQDITENIIHLVLARVPGDPPGTKGISIFVVPKVRYDLASGALLERNDVRCTGIEHKMGLNGSATCSIAFGEQGGTIGYLIGRPREGMRIMFHMMNEARLECGMQGLSIAGLAYRAALAYAKERVQGPDISEIEDAGAKRVPIIRHPDVRRMLLDMKATSEAIRAIIYYAAHMIDVAGFDPAEERRREAAAVVELMTPICKAFSTDQAFRVAETAIQVLGGYGYIQEYQVEQYCRDVKIASIYEGTNGIQALDLLGRKLPMKGGAVFMGFLGALDRFIEAGFTDWRLADAFRAFSDAKGKLVEVASRFMAMGQAGDRAYPALSAVPFLEMAGYIVCAWRLLDQAQIASRKLAALCEKAGAPATPESEERLAQDDPEARFYRGKLASARYWCARKLPLALAIGETILAEDRTPLENIF
jgi:hypothetical protein